ncbi:hypothetical protein H0E87_008520 [Populus deltoides]|uniref:Uncharacterized protein n=1 Tax=Populus deltoides TaxID=3696 RepID=A0A8T2Z136_POPDE|nr:hypothetical protein H0E87_008520 [Populus deltoides]
MGQAKVSYANTSSAPQNRVAYSMWEKAPFAAKAEKRKFEYNKDMAAYNKRLAGGNDDESDKSKSEVNDEDEEDESDGEEEDDEEIKSDDADPGKYSLEPPMKVVSSPDNLFYSKKWSLRKNLAMTRSKQRIKSDDARMIMCLYGSK